MTERACAKKAPCPGRSVFLLQKIWVVAAVGLATGLANGLFGAGGGSILVPAMEKFLKTETHKAHATAIGVILPLSAISVLIYFWGTPISWETVLYVSLGGVAGGFTGARLLNKFSAGWLHKLFGFFIAGAAIKMILG